MKIEFTAEVVSRWSPPGKELWLYFPSLNHEVAISVHIDADGAMDYEEFRGALVKLIKAADEIACPLVECAEWGNE